jgi:hypothetical protein
LIAKNKALSASNLEFVEKEGRFQFEINALQATLKNIQLERDNFEEHVDMLTNDKKAVEFQLSEMTKAKEEFEAKYADAMVTYFYDFQTNSSFVEVDCGTRQRA